MKLKATKEEGRGGSTFVTEFELIGGVSLRDYFAAKAMQAIIIGNEAHLSSLGAGMAMDAYAVADAMLAERNKGREEE